MDENRAFIENGERFIASSPDAARTVSDLVRVAAQAIGSDMGALYLTDEADRLLKPAVIYNLSDEYVKGCGHIPLGEQCCGRAALHRLPWYVDDIWDDRAFPIATREAAKRAGVRAAISVPVIARDGRCVGSLSAHFPDRHTPSEYEVQRHILFAQLIGFALSAADGSGEPTETARSLRDEQRKAPESATAAQKRALTGD